MSGYVVVLFIFGYFLLVEVFEMILDGIEGGMRSFFEVK